MAATKSDTSRAAQPEQSHPVAGFRSPNLHPVTVHNRRHLRRIEHSTRHLRAPFELVGDVCLARPFGLPKPTPHGSSV
jgi:hypothetical protein